MRVILICVLSILGAVTVFARDLTDVEIKTHAVAGQVYMLEGSGGNIGVLVGNEGVLMVDDQFKPLAEKITSALEALNPGPLKFVLNTHWHGDHVGGNQVFGERAMIVAHNNVRKRLSTPQFVAHRQKEVEAAPEVAWPVITFDSSLKLYFNSEEIHLLHLPHGHTDGDSVVFFKGSNVVHMGDHFFNHRFPFVDIDSGGNVQGYIRNVETVLNQIPKDIKIIPGHGDLAAHADLVLFRDMLVETTSFVQSQLQNGSNLASIKAQGLPAKWNSWAWGFISEEQWIETIVRSAQAT